MFKFLKTSLLSLLTLLLTFSFTTKPFAALPDCIVNTLPEIIDSFSYSNFIVQVQKIYTDKNQIAYCIEIDKSYPKGENFSHKYTDDDPIMKSLAINGYPFKSATELNVTTEDEAFFVTQVAMWCHLENYAIEQIKCDKPYLETAIRNFYSYCINNPINDETITLPIYECADKSIQKVLVIDVNMNTKKNTTVIPSTDSELPYK